MTDSLRALLSGAIDYAGMFPPAELSLEESLANWRAYWAGPQAWLLGRFVAPLDELPSLCKQYDPKEDGAVTVVFGAAGTGSERISILEKTGEWTSGAILDAIECRWPAELLQFADQEALANHVKLFALHLSTGIERRATLYFEIAPPELHIDKRLKAAVAALVAYNKLEIGSARGGIRHTPDIVTLASQCPAGMKFRLGGANANAVPTPSQLASFICACRDAGVFWKATAGLHHAIAHLDAALQCKMHGFLNVLSAAVLADVQHLDVESVEAILEDQDADHFRFEPDKMSYQDLTATVDQISAARQRSLRSFGSCSFDEPLADLRSLGLL